MEEKLVECGYCGKLFVSGLRKKFCCRECGKKMNSLIWQLKRQNRPPVDPLLMQNWKTKYGKMQGREKSHGK